MYSADELTSYRFAMLGVAGFIAPRHLKAIRDTGNTLIAALDRNDSAGILDSFFPDTSFFVEYERFDRHIDKLRRQGNPVDYISICTPNYLHDSHIRFALRNQADAICEKPLVLNPWNIDALRIIEEETGRKVNTILQLRLHPGIMALKEQIAKKSSDRLDEVDLTYITSRGNWYFTSWKADLARSGGIATNIGIHFFDMLQWIFGEVIHSEVHLSEPSRAAGYLHLKQARVRWFLSIDATDLPHEVSLKGQRTYRSVTCNGEEIEFSDGFTDLHTLSYRQILLGKGFSLQDARPSIELVHLIRNSAVLPAGEIVHPFLQGKKTIRH
jgi:UDP-N-acetyl-2-amino-2-deoxyglucuronate dehydrogenase